MVTLPPVVVIPFQAPALASVSVLFNITGCAAVPSISNVPPSLTLMRRVPVKLSSAPASMVSVIPFGTSISPITVYGVVAV